MANPYTMASMRTRYGFTGRVGNTENRENRLGGRLPQNKGNQLKKPLDFPLAFHTRKQECFLKGTNHRFMPVTITQRTFTMFGCLLSPD